MRRLIAAVALLFAACESAMSPEVVPDLSGEWVAAGNGVVLADTHAAPVDTITVNLERTGSFVHGIWREVYEDFSLYFVVTGGILTNQDGTVESLIIEYHDLDKGLCRVWGDMYYPLYDPTNPFSVAEYTSVRFCDNYGDSLALEEDKLFFVRVR